MCLTEDRLISPDEHVAYKPLATPMPVPGKRVPFKPKLMWLTRLPYICNIDLKGKAIHLSGYQESRELWILRRLVRAFGRLRDRPWFPHASD
jgi:hypothetical protein